MILRLVMHGLWAILGALWLVALAGAIVINCFGRREGTRLLAPPGKEKGVFMLVELTGTTFKAVEDCLGKIRASALGARLSDGAVAREELKNIVEQVNIATNLLLNGEIVQDAEYESKSV